MVGQSHRALRIPAISAVNISIPCGRIVGGSQEGIFVYRASSESPLPTPSAAPLPVISVSPPRPFCSSGAGAGSSPSKPKLILSGSAIFFSRASCSAQARARTRYRMFASLRWPWDWRMASLTSLATLRRSEGSTSSARAPKSLGTCDDVCVADVLVVGGRFQLSRGTMRRAMARSRSFLNWVSSGAYGARLFWANSIALAVSAVVLAVSEAVKLSRISSTSCSRSSEKCSFLSVSNSYRGRISVGFVVGGINRWSNLAIILRTEGVLLSSQPGGYEWCMKTGLIMGKGAQLPDGPVTS